MDCFGPAWVAWYQGIATTSSREDSIDLNEIDHGAILQATNGYIIASFKDPILLPCVANTYVTYYSRRPASTLLSP